VSYAFPDAAPRRRMLTGRSLWNLTAGPEDAAPGGCNIVLHVRRKPFWRHALRNRRVVGQEDGTMLGGVSGPVVATTAQAFSCALVRLPATVPAREPRFRKSMQDNGLITKPLLCRLSYGGMSGKCRRPQWTCEFAKKRQNRCSPVILVHTAICESGERARFLSPEARRTALESASLASTASRKRSFRPALALAVRRGDPC
jgi:hypothetical protein